MPGGTINAGKLAGALAEGLAAVLPAELGVFVAGTVVKLRVRGTRSGMDAALGRPRDIRARLAPYLDWAEGLQQQDFALDDALWVYPASPTEGLRQEIVAIDDARRRETSSPTADPFVEISVALDNLGSALDQFQDEVAETLTEPWPAVVPSPMPEAFAELRDDRLVAGYGDPIEPVLTVISIALQDLR
jgi:hypothetical protein